jgi:predicted nucleic acid-binding protein
VTDKVVDASAIVALLFNELTRDEVARRLSGFSLRAPNLIRFEVASACLKKIRAAPREQQALLDAFSLLDDLSISSDAVDLEGRSIWRSLRNCHCTTRAIFGLPARSGSSSSR